MFNFVMGLVVGFFVATVGVANFVAMLDNVANNAKEKVEETVQK
tara:strand:- start:746 stop:877 length:132 start_codon:yes stop_codon:yes gene_type:complete